MTTLNIKTLEEVGVEEYFLYQWRQDFGERDVPIDSPKDWLTLVKMGYYRYLSEPYRLTKRKEYRPNLKGVEITEDMPFAHLFGANCKNARLKGLVLTGSNLGEIDLEDAVLEEANLDGSNITNGKLSRVVANGASMNECALFDIDLSLAEIQRVHFYQSRMQGACLNYAHASESVFTQTNLEGATMIGTNLRNAIFERTNLAWCNFTDANLENVVFDHCYMYGAVFSRANRKGVIVTGELFGITISSNAYD